jgi:MFS family permease
VRLRPTRGLRRLYFASTAIMLCVVFAIGAFPGFWVTLIGLAAAGACTAIFSALQSTLIYSVAPPGMSGRYLGLMTISIGTGVLGFANVGIMAELFGASTALWIVALQGMPLILAVAWRWRALHDGG